MSEKIIASYYIETVTDRRPRCFDVKNVERAAWRCGTDLDYLKRAFHSLPERAKIILEWMPEDEGDADMLNYVFELDNV